MLCADGATRSEAARATARRTARRRPPRRSDAGGAGRAARAVVVVALVAVGVASCGERRDGRASGGLHESTHRAVRRPPPSDELDLGRRRTPDAAGRPAPRPRRTPPAAATRARLDRAWRGCTAHAAAWLAQRPGVTLMRFDQRYVHLDAARRLERRRRRRLDATATRSRRARSISSSRPSTAASSSPTRTSASSRAGASPCRSRPGSRRS